MNMNHLGYITGMICIHRSIQRLSPVVTGFKVFTVLALFCFNALLLECVHLGFIHLLAIFNSGHIGENS